MNQRAQYRACHRFISNASVIILTISKKWLFSSKTCFQSKGLNGKKIKMLFCETRWWFIYSSQRRESFLFYGKPLFTGVTYEVHWIGGALDSVARAFQFGRSQQREKILWSTVTTSVSPVLRRISCAIAGREYFSSTCSRASPRCTWRKCGRKSHPPPTTPFSESFVSPVDNGCGRLIVSNALTKRPMGPYATRALSRAFVVVMKKSCWYAGSVSEL